MITDDTLTLYYYDELSADEKQEIERALKADSGLAVRYSVLRRELDSVEFPAEQAVPDHMMQRLHDTIDRAARLESGKEPASKSSLHFLSFFWGAAVTAALVLGVGASIYLGEGDISETTPLVVDSGMTVVPASFTRGLQSHLRDSQFELARLSPESSADRMLLIAQIIDQNRMFERAAEKNNSQKVARVLRAFEPILLRLASDDIAPEDAEALRAQLAFELKIVLTKLEQAPSEEPQSI